MHDSRDRPDGMPSFGAGRVRRRPPCGPPVPAGRRYGAAARAPPGSPTLGGMRDASRRTATNPAASRTRVRTSVTDAARAVADRRRRAARAAPGRPHPAGRPAAAHRPAGRGAPGAGSRRTAPPSRATPSPPGRRCTARCGTASPRCWTRGAPVTRRAAAPGRSEPPAPNRDCRWTRCCTPSGWAVRWCGRAWSTRPHGRRRRTYVCWCTSRPTCGSSSTSTARSSPTRTGRPSGRWHGGGRTGCACWPRRCWTAPAGSPTCPRRPRHWSCPSTAGTSSSPSRGRGPCGCTGAQAALAPGVRVHWHTGVDADHGIVLVEGDPAAVVPDEQPPGVRVGVSGTVDGLAAVGEARRLADTALRLCPEGAARSG